MDRIKHVIIVLVAMMCVGVQGYAQHRRPHRPVYHTPVPHRFYHHPVYHNPSYRYRTVMYSYFPASGYYYYEPLNSYIYDSYERPTKVVIGNIEFKRSSGRLRIKNGKQPVVYLDTYKVSQVKYVTGKVTINVVTGDGDATIEVADEEGNTAIYTL